MLTNEPEWRRLCDEYATAERRRDDLFKAIQRKVDSAISTGGNGPDDDALSQLERADAARDAVYVQLMRFLKRYE